MKSKLIKKSDGWYNLYDGEIGIGSTHAELQGHKLSKQNCDEIFGVVDINSEVEAIVKTICPDDRGKDVIYGTGMAVGIQCFNKAMELNKDKLFTVEDFNNFIDFVINEKSKEHAFGITNKELINCHLSTYAIFQMKDLRKIYIDTFIQSLQQPIEVEVEMEPCFYDDSLGGFSTSYTEDKPKEQPKLDSEGCLILKKI
jgi:hypothetical protein